MSKVALPRNIVTKAKSIELINCRQPSVNRRGGRIEFILMLDKCHKIFCCNIFKCSFFCFEPSEEIEKIIKVDDYNAKLKQVTEEFQTMSDKNKRIYYSNI